jgi:hypothetical protein
MAPDSASPGELWRSYQRRCDGIWQGRVQHGACTCIGAGTGVPGTDIGGTAGLAVLASVRDRLTLLQS